MERSLLSCIARPVNYSKYGSQRDIYEEIEEHHNNSQ